MEAVPTMQMGQIEQSEIDQALIKCLRILARRGRQLREERERQALSETIKNNKLQTPLKRKSDLHYESMPYEPPSNAPNPVAF